MNRGGVEVGLAAKKGIGFMFTDFRRAFVLLGAAALVCLALSVHPEPARAFATIGAAPEAAPTGLPDRRVYEQVSPVNKWGNQAVPNRPAFVSSNGQAVMYTGNGTLASEPTNSGFFPISVSERTAAGWTTRSATPLPLEGASQPEEYVEAGGVNTTLVPSANLSDLLFGTWGNVPFVGPPDEGKLANNLYLEGPDPFAEPQWVGRSLIAGYPGGAGKSASNLHVAGSSPDLKTIYFFYESSLLPGASGLYEYREGVLSDAGVLPNGESSAGMAEPAAQPGRLERYGLGSKAGMISTAGFDNQVSEDGSRIFFTREDEAGALELYAHVTASDGTQSTVLISQSQLPGHIGEAAPDGPKAFASTDPRGITNEELERGGEASLPSYAFASPDGTHVLFQSEDQLTADAPAGSAPKTYDYDLNEDALEYLPKLTGSIITASDDGAAALFENTSTSPYQLEWWTAGTGGGRVTPIAQLPEATRGACGQAVCVAPAYMSSDGKTVVFETESPIPGYNDGGSHYAIGGPLTEQAEEQRLGEGLFPNSEVFSYDPASNVLSCLSCPPPAQAPTGDGLLSESIAAYNAPWFSGGPEVITPGRQVSADGKVVFFQSRQALVPQDTNGNIDVYEWENGRISLISSGHDSKVSSLVGTSESGNDAFFMTAEGLSPGDKDGGAYDVYDARVPQPGDNPPPEAVPCTGDVCQGPPSVPQLLAPSASETFNGLGNLTVSTSPKHGTARSLTPAQKLAHALRRCTKAKQARRRRRCKRRAHRRYGAKSARTTRVAGRTVHHNGRGK